MNDRFGRIRFSELYCAMIFLWELTSTLSHSMLAGVSGSMLNIIYKGICGALIAVIVMRVIARGGTIPFAANTKFVYSVILLGAAILSYVNSGRDEVLILAIAVLGAFGISRKRLVASLYKGLFMGVMIVIGLALVGVLDIGEMDTVRGGQTVTRYSLGFSHANTLAILILELCLLYLYLNRAFMKKYKYVCLLVIGLICYRVTYSRTTSICFIIVLAVAFLLRFVEKTQWEKAWNFLSRHTVTILGVLGLLGTLYVVRNYRSGVGVASLVNDMIGVRIPLLYDALQMYSINLFGQSVNIVNSQEYYLFQGTGVVLDNSYIYMLLEYGAVPTVLVLFGYLGGLRSMAKKKEYVFIICMAVYLILGFTEKYFSGLSYNFTLLVLIDFLYDRGEKKDGQDNFVYSDGC